MAQDAAADRSEPATPHKLQRAREQGRVGRSPDLVAAAVLLAAAAWCTAQGMAAAQQLFQLAGIALVQAPGAPAASTGALLQALAAGVLPVLLPLCGAMAAAAVLAAMVQGGAVWSFQALAPDWHRMHPATGRQRLWSRRTLVDAAKALAKLLVLAAVAGWVLRASLPAAMAAALLGPRDQLKVAIQLAADVGLAVAGALLAVALADAAYTRLEHARTLRMTRREVQDEHKQREGDPRVRGRLRELRRDMLRRIQVLGRTGGADLVVTNPTHYAVALRYAAGEMPAPVLVCKGAGGMAAAMRAIAHQHAVHVVHSPALARRLFREVALDQSLPVAFHAEVARLLAWVYAQRALRGGVRP